MSEFRNCWCYSWYHHHCTTAKTTNEQWLAYGGKKSQIFGMLYFHSNPLAINMTSHCSHNNLQKRGALKSLAWQLYCRHHEAENRHFLVLHTGCLLGTWFRHCLSFRSRGMTIFLMTDWLPFVRGTTTLTCGVRGVLLMIKVPSRVCVWQIAQEKNKYFYTPMGVNIWGQMVSFKIIPMEVMRGGDSQAQTPPATLKAKILFVFLAGRPRLLNPPFPFKWGHGCHTKQGV